MLILTNLLESKNSIQQSLPHLEKDRWGMISTKRMQKSYGEGPNFIDVVEEML
jgi:hypothetical protein